MQDAAANIALIDPVQCRLPPSRLPIAPERCADLAASIRTHGQLVPGLVRRTPQGDPFRYEIVCGARRHFAKIPQSRDRIIQTVAEITALQKRRIRAGRAMLPPETVLRRLHHPETPLAARHPPHDPRQPRNANAPQSSPPPPKSWIICADPKRLG